MFEWNQSIMIGTTLFIGSLLPVFLFPNHIGRIKNKIVSLFSSKEDNTCQSCNCTDDDDHDRSVIPSLHPQNVILIIDMNNAIDDILCLLHIIHQPELNLCGVITTGGDSINRARLVRYWLRRALCSDKILVIPDWGNDAKFSPSVRCNVPIAADSKETSSLYMRSKEGATSFLIKAAQRWKTDLTILCTSTFSCLAQACSENPQAMRECGKIYFCGKTFPYINDYNFKRIQPCCLTGGFGYDQLQTHKVFDMLEDTVPFRVLNSTNYDELEINSKEVNHIQGLVYSFITIKPRKFLLVLYCTHPHMFNIYFHGHHNLVGHVVSEPIMDPKYFPEITRMLKQIQC